MANNTNKYIVRVIRTKREFAVIEVEATDIEQAKEIAIDKALDNDFMDWRNGSSEVYSDEVQRLPEK